MCGIGGCVVGPGERVDTVALERMADALGHRGPDDRGIEVRDQVGFVHTRLAIVDPTPAGHQPMADRSERWLLTYNGEIFNHAELREQLPSIPYRGHSDTETLLRALVSWGDEALPRLNGQFAFAAADLTARRLLLVRDHLGIKPLYIARHGGALWFASEIGALLAAGVPRRPRPEVLMHTLLRGYPLGKSTPIAGIERVLAGRAMEIGLDTLQTRERRWYDPAAAVDPDLAAELSRRDRGELSAMVEDALQSAVRRQLMSDVPLGTMCSGGLDSSLVTAMSSEERSGVVAFTGWLRGDPGDEVAWAERTADSLGIPLEKVEIGPPDWRAALVPAVAHNEYPLGEAEVPIPLLAAHARRSGVKVLLTGEGGDELFGGYWHRHVGHYRDFLPASAQARRAIEAVHGYGPRRLIRTMARLARRRTRGRVGRLPLLAGGGLDDDFRSDLVQASSHAYSHHSGSRADLEAELLAGLSREALPPLLNRMDKNALQHSVEARVPYLDPDLIGLVVNLPLEARVGPRVKGVLRDVARNHLPRRVAHRAKRGSLARDARRMIGPAARPEFVDEGHLREVLPAELPPWHQMMRSLTGRETVRVCSAEIWCRLFLDGSSVPEVEAELWDPERV